MYHSLQKKEFKLTLETCLMSSTICCSIFMSPSVTARINNLLDTNVDINGTAALKISQKHAYIQS